MRKILALLVLAVAACNSPQTNNTPFGPASQQPPHGQPFAQGHPIHKSDFGSPFYTSPITSLISDSESYGTGKYLGKMVASIKVPTNPPSNYTGNQLWSTWIGAQQNPGYWVIQPVLYWGQGYNGGGNAWNIQALRCDSATCTNASTNVPVSQGDSIVMTIQASSCGTHTCTWTLTANDITSAHSTSSSFTDSADYVSYYSAIEPHVLTACTQIPGSMPHFEGVQVWDQSGTLRTPKFFYSPGGQAYDVNPPWCGYFYQNLVNGTTSSWTQTQETAGPTFSMSVSPTGLVAPGTKVTATATAPSGGTSPYYPAYDWTINGAEQPQCFGTRSCYGYMPSGKGAQLLFQATVQDAWLWEVHGSVISKTSYCAIICP